MRVGIIGSSQNNSKTSETYEKAVKEVKQEIDSLNVPYNEITLVSGGSSWADHIAVSLFLLLESQGIKLTLYLPCEMVESSYTTKTYFGRELNERHRAFSEICFSALGESSLKQLSILYKRTPDKNIMIVVDKNGFKSRNSQIANDVDYLIAVSNTVEVSGGTKDTWNKFNKNGTKKLLHFS